MVEVLQVKSPDCAVVGLRRGTTWEKCYLDTWRQRTSYFTETSISRQYPPFLTDKIEKPKPS